MLSNSAEVESEVGMTEEEAKTKASYNTSLIHRKKINVVLLFLGEDRGAGQQPLLRLSSFLPRLSGQPGLLVRQPSSSQSGPCRPIITSPQPLPSVRQESPAYVGQGPVPKVGKVSEQMEALLHHQRNDNYFFLCWGFPPCLYNLPLIAPLSCCRKCQQIIKALTLSCIFLLLQDRLDFAPPL